jgi:hypothetical protein
LVYSYGTALGWRRTSALIFGDFAAIASTWDAVSRYPGGGVSAFVTSTGVFGSTVVLVDGTVVIAALVVPAVPDADAVGATARTTAMTMGAIAASARTRPGSSRASAR